MITRRAALSLPAALAAGLVVADAKSTVEPVTVAWFNGIPITLGDGIDSIKTHLDHQWSIDHSGRVVTVESKLFRLELTGTGLGALSEECKRVALGDPQIVLFQSSDRRHSTGYLLEMFDRHHNGLTVELRKRV